jgi:hypothetical protein
LPLDEGPDMPTIRALGRLDVGSVIVFGLEFVVCGLWSGIGVHWSVGGVPEGLSAYLIMIYTVGLQVKDKLTI